MRGVAVPKRYRSLVDERMHLREELVRAIEAYGEDVGTQPDADAIVEMIERDGITAEAGDPPEDMSINEKQAWKEGFFAGWGSGVQDEAGG